MKLSVVILISLAIFIDPSMGCLQTEDINPDEQWACWSLGRTAARYISPNKCCSGLSCECNETGNLTSNARFGRDCKCISTTLRFVDEYYTRIAARQQQDNATVENQV